MYLGSQVPNTWPASASASPSLPTIKLDYAQKTKAFPSSFCFFLRQSTSLLDYADSSWLTPAAPWPSRHQPPTASKYSWGMNATDSCFRTVAHADAQFMHIAGQGHCATLTLHPIERLVAALSGPIQSWLPSEAAVAVVCGLPRSPGAPPASFHHYKCTYSTVMISRDLSHESLFDCIISCKFLKPWCF